MYYQFVLEKCHGNQCMINEMKKLTISPVAAMLYRIAGNIQGGKLSQNATNR